MSSKKGLSDRILNMKFMKHENLNITEASTIDEDNWKIVPFLDEAIENSIDANASKFKKPKNLVKKIHENARKISNIRRKIKEEEIKKQLDESVKEENTKSKNNRFNKK